jgi:hypothetical protein
MKLVLPLLALLVLSAAGCGTHREETARHMTEAQRDSAIARSDLPGARVVARAIGVSGREAAHAAALDTLPTQ